ncbi:hypothetical protein NJH49_02890 [Stenotrophomonas maltophilia]|uniref:hypothetical protein n=1 Tax=Stenotrophomonas maltophilia TaxID=40324 RepID=UPI002096C950|nr:hypothetical protein [Stenotrophomonas maltophilia]MCO7399899.1 hypothetical protein [Stenotrophomonas maltophilia]MCO7410334.1 hypothetical protein [Stenotrophomonas maltophilia]
MSKFLHAVNRLPMACDAWLVHRGPLPDRIQRSDDLHSLLECRESGLHLAGAAAQVVAGHQLARPVGRCRLGLLQVLLLEVLLDPGKVRQQMHPVVPGHQYRNQVVAFCDLDGDVQEGLHDGPETMRRKHVFHGIDRADDEAAPGSVQGRHDLDVHHGHARQSSLPRIEYDQVGVARLLPHRNAIA